jgi:Spy/CpxP family protein refolding chaperone
MDVETRRATVRKALGILAVMALIPVSVWAFGGPWGGGGMGPPKEAIDACAGKKAGDAVRFTAPCGDNVSAVCRELGDRLVAAPERGPGFTGRGRRGEGMGMGTGRHFERMARALDLTAEQKTQIRTVLDAEREKTAPLRQQLAETRDRMRRLVETVPYDEAAVRNLASSQEKTRVELIVSRTHALNRVYALLTPEQQEKARQFRPFGEGRPGRGPRM